ncbi:MAG: sugar phosphate isomerase/epimerase [Dysgonamonadaceae bacterium]|jgi:sugar phosphate isomerase/epimerase|nr:sugar phosphate isomerase/epimerase [Dysgonamonadaceae bacterium]
MKTLKYVLLVVCAFIAVSCNQETKVEKNIGLQMYSLRGPIGDATIGIDSVITAVGQMGYKYVENFGYNENDGLTYGLSPEELKAKLNTVGVDILSTHVRKDLPSEKTEANDAALWAWWDKCIADHKVMGAKYIVMPSMPTPETLEGLQAYCDYYNAVGEKCLEAGLKFGYHNHNYEFEKKYETADGNISMYDYLVQHTDPAKVFFQLDVYWAIVGRRAPVELFEQYPGRFEVLHIKDSKELGRSGFVGFDAIFNHIDLAKAKYLIVEVERYNIPPIESVKESLDYLNNADFVKDNYAE